MNTFPLKCYKNCSIVYHFILSLSNVLYNSIYPLHVVPSSLTVINFQSVLSSSHLTYVTGFLHQDRLCNAIHHHVEIYQKHVRDQVVVFSFFSLYNFGFLFRRFAERVFFSTFSIRFSCVDSSDFGLFIFPMFNFRFRFWF